MELVWEANILTVYQSNMLKVVRVTGMSDVYFCLILSIWPMSFGTLTNNRQVEYAQYVKASLLYYLRLFRRSEKKKQITQKYLSEDAYKLFYFYHVGHLSRNEYLPSSVETFEHSINMTEGRIKITTQDRITTEYWHVEAENVSVASLNSNFRAH